MTLQVQNRIKETAPAPGTSAFALGGAVTGFRVFSSKCANGDTIFYSAWDGAGAWEIGLGTWNTGNTLSRTLVLDSSTGSAINFANAVTVWGDRPATMDTLPTQQQLTSGSGATYTTPTDCRQIRIRMWGAGGGGGGGATGSNGTDTIFNGVHAGGGGGGGLLVGGSNLGPGGQGGVSTTGTANFRLTGQVGGPFTMYSGGGGNFSLYGGAGGGNGGGLGGSAGNAGANAAPNTGGGGGGGGQSSGATTVAIYGAGGAGEYVELIISNPAATYTYTVGTGGAGGASGGATAAGGIGGSGLIIVDEIYGS